MAKHVSADIDVIHVENGDAILFERDEDAAGQVSGRVSRKVAAGRVFIDGTHTGEVGDEVLRDRRHLAGDGLVVPVLAINGITGVLEDTPEVITRGFVVDQKTDGLLKEVPALMLAMLEQTPVEERTDPGLMKERVRAELQKFFRKRAGRRPLVLPVIMEV